MSKIHVLPDEKLNGVLREYIEVERKANAGEKIIGKNTGNIYTVLNVFSSLIETDTRQRIHHRDYFVLEPTDIVRIDGKRYRMVDREAKVGDKIIIVKNLEYRDWFKIGEIAIVEEVDSNGDVFADFNENKRVYGDGKWCVGRFYYYVLEPLHTCDKCGKPLGETACSNQKGGSYCSVDCAKADDETEASKSVLDLLANLAQRVTELERQQKENRELIIKAFESIYGKDNVFTVEERVAMLEREVSEMYKRLRKSEEKIEMALDDIITLDERTQPLLAIIKAVKDDG